MSIQAHELLKQIESGTAPVIVDVRSGWEYRQGSVPGAIHLPFWRSWALNETLKEKLGHPVVAYCEHGPRAVLASLFLRLRGIHNVQMLKGHMLGWRKRGLPVEKHGSGSNLL